MMIDVIETIDMILDIMIHMFHKGALMFDMIRNKIKSRKLKLLLYNYLEMKSLSNIQIVIQTTNNKANSTEVSTFMFDNILILSSFLYTRDNLQ